MARVRMQKCAQNQACLVLQDDRGFLPATNAQDRTYGCLITLRPAQEADHAIAESRGQRGVEDIVAVGEMTNKEALGLNVSRGGQRRQVSAIVGLRDLGFLEPVDDGTIGTIQHLHFIFWMLIFDVVCGLFRVAYRLRVTFD